MAKSASDQNAKQQILEKLRDVDTVMVTVSSSPSVDELSAALGLTLALNKLNKHATAVFSGDIPPAITFLNPEKTFENTVDSLRDFIIALDKEKADHLRYKVEGEMVKIFITPYRTTIDQTDLEFSQGDYNVEMVMAIGVRDNNDLDRALAEHGRILHDATVAGISIGSDSSDIGSISWHAGRASSYSELLADLVTTLRSDKNVLDEQIATALLTGIVAATDRFSNQHTSSEAMTIAAQLMAAGANQQLIATKLEESDELTRQNDGPDDNTPSESNQPDDTNNDGSTTLSDGEKTKIDHDKKPKKKASKKGDEPIKDRQAPDGSMSISHEKRGDVDEVAKQVVQENQAAATEHAEEILAKGLADKAPAAAPSLSVADLQNDLKQAAEEIETDAAMAGKKPSSQPSEDAREISLPPPAPADDAVGDFIETPLSPPAAKMSHQPAFGGTLNATSEQAADDKRREEEADRNKTLLTHGGSSYAAGPPAGYPTINSFTDKPAPVEPPNSVLPAVETDNVSSRGQDLQPITPPEIPAGLSSSPEPTLSDIDTQNRGAVASDAMSEALEMANSTSQQQQQMPNMPPLPPLPSVPQTADPSTGGLPPLPPLPDFSALPPLPPGQEPALPTVSTQNQGPAPTASPTDPAQFQIPSQQP